MNILIVDDNQDNRMTLELLLEDIDGINLKEAVDGAEAISMCQETRFDLIFMDIMMPNVDGIEATQRIKSFSPSSMIIALSALDDDNSKHTMLQSGAEDYITKPIDSELFTQRVKNYMSIIAMRAKPLHSTSMASLFSDTAYPLSKTFTIDSEASLAYYWDYCLNGVNDKPQYVSDVVLIIYGIGLWILKTGQSFKIISEENDDYLYLTQTLLPPISEGAIRNILLKHCGNTPYILKKNTLSFKLKKAAQEETSPQKETSSQKETLYEEVPTYAKTILSKTHFNKVTASEYVEMTAIALMDKLESLETLEDEIDISLIDFEKENTAENLRNASRLFLDYVEVIQQLTEFEHLAYAVESLADFLATLEESQFDEKKIKKLVLLTMSLLSDLSTWRINVFIKREANDIHYLDSSLLSSCLQIESIFKEEKVVEEEEDDDELEFF